MNEGSQIGVHNGATGIVVGFAFKNGDNPDASRLKREGSMDKISCEIVSLASNRPLILVQLDKTDSNKNISCIS
jgi:hypothetical protein